MVSFSHHDAGTPEHEWAAAGAGRLPVLGPGVVPGAGERLVVVAAHPDDESLGAAGLVRAALRQGATVHVVVCTAGEASHPGSPTHTPEQLAELRTTELEVALGLLRDAAPDPAALSWEHLGLPDGALAEHRDDLEAALGRALDAPRWMEDPHSTATRTVLAAPYRFDGHTDHDTAGACAARAAARWHVGLLEFPIWYWHWATPRHGQWTGWQTLPLDAEAQEAKQAVLGAHRSQTAALSAAPGDEVLLGAGFLEHFRRRVETFAWTPPRPRDSTSAAAVFDRLYRRNGDPWDYLGSSYERRKRAVTLASLPRGHYADAVEAGCSIGVLTAELAGRCSRLLGIDASRVALSAARTRLEDAGHVSLLRAQLPAGWPRIPGGSLDLVVLSEIGYFLGRNELRDLLHAAAHALAPGGDLLLCHWLHPIDGWELDGAQVHEMARELGWKNVVTHREEDFLLDVLRSPGGTDA